MSIYLVSTATEVLLTLVSSAISAGLIYLLIRSIRRENAYYSTLTSKHLTLDATELRTLINREITRERNDFVLFEISLGAVENIERVCGGDQLSLAKEELVKRLLKIFESSARVSFLSKERLWVMVKSRFKREALKLVLDNVIAAITRPIVLIGDLSIEFDCNIAALVYQKELGNLEAVSASLELATIAAKKKGNNTAVIYDRSFEHVSTEQYTLFCELQTAIKNKDFRIFYQPIINTKTLDCYAVEAYLRWQHSQKGIISPDVFLPLLEHSGDINWVGLWAMDEIARQLEYWRINNPEISIKININWSITQLSRPTLAEEIKKILKKYKVSASDFMFEISDYKAAQSTQAAIKTLATLRALGIGIAIDNVGLQMDTLLTLKGDEVNMFKFNREFIMRIMDDNEGAKNVAEMVVKTARASGIKIVGEGVENRETLQILAFLGINYAQGYLISRPKAPSEAMADIVLTPWKD